MKSHLSTVLGLVVFGLTGTMAHAAPIKILGRHQMQVAQAQVGAADCLVTEIKASNTGGGVDPKLDRIKGKLKGMPYDTFKLIAEQTVSTELAKPATTALAVGKATLLLKNRSNGTPARLQYGIDVDNAGGKRVHSTTFSVDSGDSISPWAGPSFEDGKYMLVLTCTAK
jgi:hypothetical protein